MELNYEQDLWIDSEALDVEWLNQPQLMMKYSSALADAETEVARLKEKLGITKADLDLKIRKDPEKFGLEKIVEAAVFNTIILNKEYQAENDALIEAQYEVKMMRGAVESVEHRKVALQDLVKLHGQQYFAGPSVPRDLSREVHQKEKQQRVNESIGRTRRRK